MSMNNHRATFSIKAITGIDCPHVSLVTVQLTCFTRIKTVECGITQACDMRIFNGASKAPAIWYRFLVASAGLKGNHQHMVGVSTVDFRILDNAFSRFTSYA